MAGAAADPADGLDFEVGGAAQRQRKAAMGFASLRLWPFDAEEPKVRLHLHMLELATVKSMVAPGLADAEGVMRLKLQGLIGDSLALAGGRSVFVCSALEGEPLQLRSALELSAAFTSERSRVVLVTLSVQLSPTQGLLDTWHLLAPLFTKTKTEGGADLDGIPAEYVEGDRRPEAQRARGVASSQCCLIIHEVDVGLHLGSAEHGAALCLGSLQACSARPAAASRVSAQLSASEAEAKNRGHRSDSFSISHPTAMKLGCWALAALLPLADAHAGFWWFRKGCQAIPTPTKRVMANEPTVLTVDKELLVHGAPKGRYVPGKKLLVNIDTAVAEHLLHVTSGAFEAKESDEPPSVKCDDALATWGIMEERRSIWWTAPAASAGPVNLTMLSASSYGPVDFYQITLHPSDGRDWRPAELRLKRLGVSVAQVPSGAKELHAGGVFVTWLAVLHQIQAAVVLDDSQDALSRCRAAALRVGRLALWSSGVKDEPEEMESHERAELLRLCPMRPDEEEPFYRLLKLPGAEKTSPWLALTLQGVWQEDRFHTMEPYLREGCAVFRDASGEHFLCSRFGQAWSKSSPSGEMRGLDPQKVRFHADRKVLSLDLAPTQLLLRRMDLLPLRRLVRNLQELGQLRPKREAPQPLSRAHAREADRMPCARWQILLRADIEVRLAELPACPSLVLRCRPSKELARGAAKLMVRLEELSVELLAAEGQVLARLALRELRAELRPGAGGEKEVSAMVGNIMATHGCERQMWLRQMNAGDQHVSFKYCRGNQLDFAIEPTALRLHCAWMQPVASLLWGLTWWRQQSRLQEPEPEMGLGLVPVVPKVEVASDVVSPTATGEDTALQPWHGTVWLLPWEPVGEQAPAGARVALQIPADGTLWARRQSTAWLPLNNNSVTTNYRHFSTQIFPHGLCCTGAEFSEGSRCCVAFDAEEDKDAVVRIFAALHFQRVRKSSPPVISVPASSITTRAPRSSLANTSARVFQRSKTVTTTLASRLASRSPASNRSRSVTSPFSKRSPATPAQASVASANDEVAEAAQTAAGASGAGMAVHIQLKALEFWLPSEKEVLANADAAILESDNRELGFLVVASAEGETGSSVQVSAEHLAAVVAPLHRCWWPEAEELSEKSALERPPWPELTLEKLEIETKPDEAEIMPSFGALKRWAQSSQDAVSPQESPLRGGRPQPPPLDLMERITSDTLPAPSKEPMQRMFSPVEERVVTALERLARGESCEGQLVETRGLQMVLLWQPEKLVGVRLESFFVNVPLEVVRWWQGFKEHTSALVEFSNHGAELLQAPTSSRLWAAPMQLPLSRGTLRPQLEKEPELPVRKWNTLFSGKVMHRASTSTLASETTHLEKAETASLPEETQEGFPVAQVGRHVLASFAPKKRP
ncbi:unnamed protein product [Effrenium voratum]|nr:unnamed protein product [Effrenium voratum]